jgi:hypothetical protein
MDDSQDVIEEDDERDVDEFNLIMRHLYKGELRVHMAEPASYRLDGRGRRAFAYCLRAQRVVLGGDDREPSSSSRSSRSSRSLGGASYEFYSFPPAPRSEDLLKELLLPLGQQEEHSAAPKPASEVSFRPSTKDALRFRYRPRTRLHRHRLSLRVAGVSHPTSTTPLSDHY